jgi:tetratricopeptide (TPR) repeat protein
MIFGQSGNRIGNSKMKNWFKVFILFFMFGLLLYFNSLNNKFLIDDNVFLNNPVSSDTKFILSQWDPYREQALGVMDSEENLGYYRPMAHMVYDFCYGTFKNNLWQYHLLNLFLFVFASLLIYLLIEKITGNYNLAFFAGFFYLIHPINGIIVNYISASVFPFQVICVLGAIWLLLGSLERKNNRALYFLSLLFSFLSLFWNESGVMTPFYICTVILLFNKGPYKEKIFYLFPYFLIVLSYLVFRGLFLSHNDDIIRYIALYHMTGWEYLANLFQVFRWYISQLFYPQGIVMTWATPIVRDHIIWNVLGLCSLLMIFRLLFIRFAKEKIIQMALIWMFIGFAPVSLAAFLRPDVGALIEPHWFVISSIGFFILAAYFCLIILERTKKIGSVLLFILIFAWGSVSHANNLLWADQKTYALYWSQQVPHLKLPYFYLAQAYQKQGDLKESKKYFRMSLSGYSTDLSAYINLAEIDIKDGHFKEAESYSKTALQIDPNSAVAYNNLGGLYYAEGQLKQARENYDRALGLNPFLTGPRIGLASILLKHSEYHKAIDLCLKNLDIVDDDTTTLLLLISIFIREKDFVNLKKYTYRLINPVTDPGILTYLGVFMSHHNAPELALDCFKKAMRIAPDYSDAYMEAGTLFANLGKYDEAVRIWKIGSSIDPSDQRFKNSIVKAMTLKLK